MCFSRAFCREADDENTSVPNNKILQKKELGRRRARRTGGEVGQLGSDEPQRDGIELEHEALLLFALYAY